MNQLLQQNGLISEVQLCSIRVIEDDSRKEETDLASLQGISSSHEQIQELLTVYEAVFQEPSGLPPVRAHDHKILLMEGTDPINLRPCRYNNLQKDLVEKLVQELIDNKAVQHSKSPFAAPVVLIKKKDGNWHICVDYHEINKKTLKNKYPIPLIEELREELHGPSIYSKIDPCSGYHQIWIHPPNVHKTAFQTHNRHYEFLIMHFGLTNAPCTFQNLMNDLFRTYRHKFVLVFFDDILIYNANLAEHLIHLKMVLEVLREQFLYATKSKCYFGESNVKYLDHIINQEGVATDPNKIKAVVEWPVPMNLKQLLGFFGLTGHYRRFV